MKIQDFPIDPAKRRIIMVLRRQDFEHLELDSAGCELLQNDQCHLLTLPVDRVAASHPALRRILDSPLDAPGATLVQSPFDADHYVQADQSVSSFAFEKHTHFLNLCSRLGAKEVAIKEIEIETDKRKSRFEVQADANVPVSAAIVPISFNAKRDFAEVRQMIESFQLRAKFKGGPPDLAGADELLKQTGLRQDPSFRNLVEMLRNVRNPLKKHQLKISLLREAQQNLKVLAKLSVPTWLKASVEVDTEQFRSLEFKLMVTVEF